MMTSLYESSDLINEIWEMMEIHNLLEVKSRSEFRE